MIDGILKCFIIFIELYSVSVIVLAVNKFINIRKHNRYTRARHIRRMRQIDFNNQCAEKGAELAYIDNIRRENNIVHRTDKQRVIYKGYFTEDDIKSLEESSEQHKILQ